MGPQLKTRRIKIHPTPNDAQRLAKWIGCARYIYNKTREEHIAGGVKKDLRQHIVNNDNYPVGSRLDWVLETPHEIRDNIFLDYFSAFKSSKKKQAEKGKTFTASDMKTKGADEGGSIRISHQSWNRGDGEFAFIKEIPTSETLPKEILNAVTIHLTPKGEFYLLIPIPIRSIKSNTPSNVVALDPGVRAFQTTFDLNGVTTEWGRGDMKRLSRIMKDMDKIKSQVNTRWDKNQNIIRSDFDTKNWDGTDRFIFHLPYQKRRRMRKAMARMQERIQNIVNDLHRKLARWLCEHYSVILIPKFETQQMARKILNGRRRRIGREIVRRMMAWSHYKFQTHLINKAREFPGVRVYIVDEAYTSKTCTFCGHLHEDLGSSEQFVCPAYEPEVCGMVLDRDVNGARNILLRFLSTHKL